MKVIFLDVDGVLNCGSKPQFVRCVDPAAAALLWAVVEQTGAKIVVSSTWRLGRFDELVGLLSALGFRDDVVIDSTPHLCEPTGSGSVLVIASPRRAEISAWLAAHPEVVDYVIIDDDEDAGIPGHFVRTTWQHGFERQHARRAIHLLTSGARA